MSGPHLKPKVEWDEDRGVLSIDGRAISISVLAAIVDPNKRLLWRFTRNANKIEAIPFSEDHVVWLDMEEREEGQR